MPGFRPAHYAGKFIALLLLVALSGAAAAHKPSDSYLRLRADEALVQGEWDIALRDLDFALALDTDQDGVITWGEVRRRQAEIDAYALARLTIRADGSPCPAEARDHLIDRHSDGAYAVILFDARCVRPPEHFSVTYRLLFDLDPQHRGLLQLAHRRGIQTAIFAQDSPTREFAFQSPDRFEQFFAYLRHGVWHISVGADHILFLLSLLIPAVLHRAGTRWLAAKDFKSSLVDVVQVVTAFTIAHSITLSLAALGVASLPSRLVESAIAASVLLAAANNIYPLISERRWIFAFIFGLVHGFGFASVLSDLGLPREALLITLIAFNVGVELGQLAIVAAFLPLAWLARRRWIYLAVTVYGGSIGIAALALAWLVERALDVRLLS
jgi:hypothetical protein